MKYFASEFTVKALTKIGWQEGEPIFHPWISKGIERAQKKVEERNFDIRKSLLEYDEVMDYQRKVFYSRRKRIISKTGLKEMIDEIIESVIEKACVGRKTNGYGDGTSSEPLHQQKRPMLDDDYRFVCIAKWAVKEFRLELKKSDIVVDNPVDEIMGIIKKHAMSMSGTTQTKDLRRIIEVLCDITDLRKKAEEIEKIVEQSAKKIADVIETSEIEAIEKDLSNLSKVDLKTEEINTLIKRHISNIAGFTKAREIEAIMGEWCSKDVVGDVKPDEIEAIIGALEKNITVGLTPENIEATVEAHIKKSAVHVHVAIEEVTLIIKPFVEAIVSHLREKDIGIVVKTRAMDIANAVRAKEIEGIIKYLCQHIANAIAAKNIEAVIRDLAKGIGGDLKAEELGKLIRQKAKDNANNNISLSIGEYLEDYSDRRSWDIAGLCKWAMSAFSVNLSPGKVKDQSPEEIEEQLESAAAEQIDKKDCSQLNDFLKEDFAIRTFAEWARAKFDIKLDIEQLKDLNASETRKLVTKKTSAKYKRREIEYPVEFAMNMVYGPEGANIYAFEALADWANKKYKAGLTVEHLQNTNPRQMHKQLLELSESYNNGELDRELSDKVSNLEIPELVKWANERFDTSLTEEDLGIGPELKEKLYERAREFLRRELSDLEKYVLIQVYDGAWKDHLYTMDHLKSSIWTRSFAEKDPKTEYKREGFKMFEEMLDAIEDRVSDIIFKVRLEAGTRARSVWRVSQMAHDEVGQFAMAERQRAAAQAPQGEPKVKQIRLEKPKVGRNDPCPCGSGKKYKKCCGKSV